MRRTVEELETAGICAMSIEDTVLPRPYGANGKPSLSSVEEGVGKMKAALSARRTKTSSFPDAPVRWGASRCQTLFGRGPIYRGTMIPGHMSKSEQQLRGRTQSGACSRAAFPWAFSAMPARIRR